MGHSLSPRLPRRPLYLAKVPGLSLDAVSCAQEDEAVLVQQVLPALSFIRQEHSILWREAGKNEALGDTGLALHLQASALHAQLGFSCRPSLQLQV